MKIQGEERYPHPRELVWRALLDPEILSRTLPGCEDLEQVGENEYAGKLKMKVGPVQGVFQGGVVLEDLRELEGYHMKIDGKGAPGFMTGKGTLELEDVEVPEAENGTGTLLRYDIDAQVGGRIASVGQRLLDSSAKVITKQGLQGLARQLDALAARENQSSSSTTDPASEVDEAPDVAAPGVEPSPTTMRDRPVPETEKLPRNQLPDSDEYAQPPSQGEFAKEFAREMANELVPRRSRPAIVIALVLFVVALVALYLRAC